ncbi:MAG: vitamin K epoxide reductase family protein [Chloroflexi bacterium]|nr:vitamin K epoxide reductase family protein [Chloroflexota bacterium]MCC6892008.1 vitamin K epoxide reductase family protein [Anaerolineae bacterium]
MSTVENTQTSEVTHTSSNWQHTVSIVLVIIGLLISGYLSYVKIVNVQTVCVQGSAFNCEVVTNSIYSRLFNVPIAYLGFATNLVILALLLLEKRIGFLQEYGVLLQFGVILFAFLFSVWLVYVQFFRLQALCIWCLLHELYVTLLFIISIVRLKRSLV